MGASLTEAAAGAARPARGVRRVTRGKSADGEVRLGEEDEPAAGDTDEPAGAAGGGRDGLRAASA